MLRINVHNLEKAQIEKGFTKKSGRIDDALTAKILGVSHTTLWRAKKGVVGPRSDFIVAILRTFKGYSFEHLFVVDAVCKKRNAVMKG